MVTRRKAILVLAVGLVLSAASAAWATVARSVALAELVQKSQLVATATPLEAHSRWEDFGGQRRIVTYTRVRVDSRVAGTDLGSEVLVRTLGGEVGNIGQVVDGEAVLEIGQPSLLFFAPGYDGVLGVTAMAQGQFPIRADDHGALRLTPSPRLPALVGNAVSAQQALVGRTVPEARALVEKAARAH